MKLLVAGGGTGGHLFPGIAVAEEFLSRDAANEVLFVGTERGVEAKLVPKLGYRLELISAAGIRGKSLLGQLKGLAGFLYGYAESRRILKEFKPDLVLGVGGYASGPVVLAARGMLIPRFVHEQNAIPGMTNKLLSRVAEQTFISLEESRRFFPKETTLLTGNPLRKQILVEAATERRGEKDENLHLLVFGGSLGAHSINLTLAAAAPLLAAIGSALTVTHQTGEKDFAEVAAAYRLAGVNANVVPFIDDMAAEYRAADLVVCRAGATTIAEVTACGKACIFIPFPHAVDDHQRKNAEALLKCAAGFMILERELTAATLVKQITDLISSPELLRETGENARSVARIDAAKIIVDEMMQALQPEATFKEYSVNYWLFKTEPGCFSFDDLKNRPEKTEHWDGVRNFQARNFLRDAVKPGDLVLFYHSNIPAPAIVGIAEVVRGGYPDFTALDPTGEHFDPKASPANPVWYMVDVRYLQALPREVTLESIKNNPLLGSMPLVNRSRLSIQPVAEEEWRIIMTMGGVGFN